MNNLTDKVLYLPIETIARELNGNLLLTYEAIKKGYAVVVGKKSEIAEFARYICGGIYLGKHWEKSFPYKFSHPERKHYYYIGFHPEGFVYRDNDFGNLRVPEGKAVNLNLNFVFGQIQRSEEAHV